MVQIDYRTGPAARGRKGWALCTLAAFVLALMLVMVRATLNESVRYSSEVTPGTELMPRSPGPATGLGLDLLCCLPALLVLARRTLDRTYVLRGGWSFLPLLALSAWMILSTIWAADKFAAIVTAFHWLAAATLLWAAAQLVRDWLRLRIVGSLCLGLLGLYIVQAANYRLLEIPALQRYWLERKAQTLKETGHAPDSFWARQMEKRISSGEYFGFNLSPNTFGALLVLLTTITGGLLVQRVIDGAKPAAFAAGILLPLGVLAAILTGSKAAGVAIGLAALILLGIGSMRDWLAAHARRAYFTGVAVLLLAIAAVVGHGLAHGRLPGASLAVRWYYWVGAARILLSSPRLGLLGTGWSNFGVYYLQQRLPQAIEEVKDPHCFIVHFFVELGVVGGVLMLAWMLRLWWELTRPSVPLPPAPTTNAASSPRAMDLLGVVAGGVVLLTVCLSADWSQHEPYLLLNEFMMRLIYGAALLVLSVLAAIRSLKDPRCDARPAPWVLYAILVALGMLLVQNLVDFSLFESGPMFLFALLTGSALGMRYADDGAEQRAGAGWALVGGVVLWLTAAAGLWGPTVLAESSAAAGDQALASNHYATAMNFYTDAAGQQPLNSDYWYRAALAAIYGSLPQTPGLLGAAIAADPCEMRYYQMRARYEASSPTPRWELVYADFRQAVDLDPHNADLRLEFADALMRSGLSADRREAREEYRAALAANDKLPPGEMRRLTPQKVRQTQQKIRELGGKTGEEN